MGDNTFDIALSSVGFGAVFLEPNNLFILSGGGSEDGFAEWKAGDEFKLDSDGKVNHVTGYRDWGFWPVHHC